jgi:hypothetical protein
MDVVDLKIRLGQQKAETSLTKAQRQAGMHLPGASDKASVVLDGMCHIPISASGIDG